MHKQNSWLVCIADKNIQLYIMATNFRGTFWWMGSWMKRTIKWNHIRDGWLKYYALSLQTINGQYPELYLYKVHWIEELIHTVHTRHTKTVVCTSLFGDDTNRVLTLSRKIITMFFNVALNFSLSLSLSRAIPLTCRAVDHSTTSVLS